MSRRCKCTNQLESFQGRIKFFHQINTHHIYIHFETSFDVYIAQDLIKESKFEDFLGFNSQLRIRFARSLLLATQMCHIVVVVEPSSSFDSSYLALFKGLKIIRGELESCATLNCYQEILNFREIRAQVPSKAAQKHGRKCAEQGSANVFTKISFLLRENWEVD